MHPDVAAYIADLQKRRKEREKQMFIKCVAAPNTGRETYSAVIRAKELGIYMLNDKET